MTKYMERNKILVVDDEEDLCSPGSPGEGDAEGSDSIQGSKEL